MVSASNVYVYPLSWFARIVPGVGAWCSCAVGGDDVRASDWTVEGLPLLPDCQLLVVLCCIGWGVAFGLGGLWLELVKGWGEGEGRGEKI